MSPGSAGILPAKFGNVLHPFHRALWQVQQAGCLRSQVSVVESCGCQSAGVHRGGLADAMKTLDLKTIRLKIGNGGMARFTWPMTPSWIEEWRQKFCLRNLLRSRRAWARFKLPDNL